MQPEPSMNSGFYIISSEWLNEWKAFVNNKPCKGALLSENNKVGVLPPGPINNHTLFSKSSQNTGRGSIKKGLDKKKDYDGLNKNVWDALQKIYGGGPVIVR